MGYQALLFCPDEKLARVVSQVFSELDFAVDPVHEPFAAVKQLMAHRYDAIVVDCENEQNASLLFRSARNSSFNQSSLAFALVEGQNGVAKAYRIGANLVLTKPINIEQAKGTLRVARGLLRKSSDPLATGVPSLSSTTAPAKTTAGLPEATGVATAQAISGHEASPAAVAGAVATPAMTAAAPIVERTTAVAPPAAHGSALFSFKPGADAQETPAAIGMMEDAVPARNLNTNNGDKNKSKNEKEEAVPISAAAGDPAVSPISGSAAAPAPAKELASSPAKEKKLFENKPAPYRPSPVAAPVLMSNSSAKAFGALNEESSPAADRNKKILIAAVIVLALAALGYLTDGRLSKFTASPNRQPAGGPPDSGQSTPAVKPMSYPMEEAPADKSGVARSTGQPSPARQKVTVPLREKPSAGVGDPETTRIAANPEPAMARSKSAPLKPRVTEHADDPAPPPSTFVTAAGGSNNLSSLISSASYNPDKPALATLRVSQGVSQGLLIKRVQPKYPAEALAVHAQGSVQIEATINKEGNVINPKVLKGDPILARAALDAVRQWRYKPYYLDGQPVEIQTQVTINFKTN